MSTFQEIPLNQLSTDLFYLIGQNWALLTAEKDGIVNTMTISWGQFGVMWRKNVVVVAIRPQRYTKEFVDAADRFSLSFLGDAYRRQLNYLGKVSGRDVDKIQEAKLTVAHHKQVPYFTQAHTVITARKLFAQPITADSFIDESIAPTFYADNDFHTLYFGEITSVLTAK